MRSGIIAADLFQWTDLNGVIHFTDNSYAFLNLFAAQERFSFAKFFRLTAPFCGVGSRALNVSRTEFP